MSIRTYVWRASDLSRAWDQLTDFARDVAAYVNAPRATDEIADAAITIAKLAPRPMLSVYCATALALVSGTPTPIQFTLRDYEVTSSSMSYDPVAYRVSIGRAGLYRVMLRFGLTAAAVAAGRVAAIIRRNGSDVAEAACTPVVGSTVTPCVSVVLSLAQGDQIQCIALQTTGGAQALLTTASQRAQLQIEYVGDL